MSRVSLDLFDESARDLDERALADRAAARTQRLSRAVRGAASGLLRAVGSAALVFALVSTGWSDARAASLSHGPVFGGVTPRNARIFVRTDVAATVSLVYGTDPLLVGANQTLDFMTEADSDFTQIISVGSLPVDQAIYVDVLVDGVSQLSDPYPSFTTFPGSPTPVEFNVLVLADFFNLRSRREPSVAETFFTAALEENVGFLFIGGDFDHRNPTFVHNRRSMFKELYNPNSMGMEGFVDLLRRYPIAHHWDDHDAGENNTDKTYPFWSEAYEVFRDYVPIYPSPVQSPLVYQPLRYAHVDFFVLDNRSQRDPASDPDDENKSMLDGDDRGNIGQLAQLKARLANSSSRWKVIFSSVPANPTTKETDGWAAYQTEWNEIRDHIESNNIEGVVVVSGDLHMGAIDDGTASGFPEMIVPRANIDVLPTQNCSTSTAGNWTEGTFNPMGGPCNGYSVIRFLLDPDRLVLEVKDEFGVVKLTYTVF